MQPPIEANNYYPPPDSGWCWPPVAHNYAPLITYGAIRIELEGGRSMTINELGNCSTKELNELRLQMSTNTPISIINAPHMIAAMVTIDNIILRRKLDELIEYVAVIKKEK